MQLRWPWVRRSAKLPGVLGDLVAAALADNLDPGLIVREAYKENPTVFTATQLIATSAKAVPWVVARRAADGDLIEEPPTHDVAKLLQRPNPWHPWEYVVEHFMGNMVLFGEAFALLNGPTMGKPTEILPIPNAWVRVERNQLTQDVVRFVVQNGGAETIVPPERMVYVFTWNPTDPRKGQGFVQAAARSIDTSNKGRRWNSALLGNMARTSGAYVSPGTLTDVQFQRLEKQLKESYGGAANAGRIMVLEGGADFKRHSLTPEEMDFTAGLRETKRDISTTLGVAPELLGDPETKTYANALQARLALYEDRVFPLLRHVAHTLTLNLRKWWPDLVLHLDIDQVPAVQERRQEFAKTLLSLVGGGIVTPNEARAALGYEEVTGADDLLVPISVVPLGSLADEGKPEEDPEDAEEGEGANGNGKARKAAKLVRFRDQRRG
ncbi:MAG TPA: phage portal protein [Candidatus Thermoplasmatota archaeon]|jgi:HK97 family phage portal protein|nr:phage portal protein [Candidatus Thermoplasmatota archaeon]